MSIGDRSASRRTMLGMLGIAAAMPALGGLPADAAPAASRIRVISDNDFAGDPDGLFQLAHHLLSPSVAIPLIVGSHLHEAEFGNPGLHQASDAAAKVHELLRVMGRDGAYRVVAGSERAMASRSAWRPGPATAAIVAEAMRDDTKAPLFYAAGAGLTELAIAWLAEPRIGRRIRLVWIGGNEHPGLAYPPPGPREPEYNLTIDLVAARVIFNESDIEIWQVPRDAYRQMMFGMAELRDLARTGPLGRYLKGQIDRVVAMVAAAPGAMRQPAGETYVLGDSPLVTLTALQTYFQPDPSSSSYRLLPTPVLDEHGEYGPPGAGRPMRVYTAVDAGLTFRDMVSKIRASDAGSRHSARD